MTGRLSKREFLLLCGKAFCSLSLPHLFGFSRTAFSQMPQLGLIGTRISPYAESLTGQEIKCLLCPRECRLKDGERGFCRVRENRSGQCYSLVYGNPCAFHLDPIERIPFFHVLPASTSLSLATAGCNFHCKFCQTWEISQASPEEVYGYDLPPDLVVTRARQIGASSVAFTFVEPVIFFEYMVDVARQAKKSGLLSVIHSNGFINPEPLKNLCQVLDAANIDLKSISGSFYRDLCGGELKPVLETLKILKQENIHLEVTNLVVPTKNDELALIRKMCLWIKNELGPETPVHFLRFYPLYKLRNLTPTSAATLEKARDTALSCGLEYVYIGNVPGCQGENTFCPQCGKMIVKRIGFMVGDRHVKNGRCGYCGHHVPGIWN